MKSNSQHDRRSPLAVVVLNPLKHEQWVALFQQPRYTLKPLHENVPSERPKVFQIWPCWEVLDLWTQHHHSFHYIPHSPLNLIISSCALSGSVCGHVTELNWIGQWSHCKCITLTLAIFQSYLLTEFQYYCRSTTWYWRMHVERSEQLEVSIYKLHQCIIYSVTLYHWSSQSYVKHTFEHECALMKKNV